MNDNVYNKQKWEVAAMKCGNCSASFLSLHPSDTLQPVECDKCGQRKAYFSDSFPVVLHQMGETYHLRVSTGNDAKDDITTSIIGSGFSLKHAFMDLMHKLETKI